MVSPKIITIPLVPVEEPTGTTRYKPHHGFVLTTMMVPHTPLTVPLSQATVKYTFGRSVRLLRMSAMR